jgi:hypothetical protein
MAGAGRSGCWGSATLFDDLLIDAAIKSAYAEGNPIRNLPEISLMIHG